MSNMKIEKELQKTKEKLEFITTKYASMDVLKKEYNLYRKSAKDGNKKSAADIEKIYHLKKKRKSIEEKNGILKDKEGSKYKEQCEKVRLIIGKYQSLKVLKQKYNLYRKNNNRKHGATNNGIRNYNNNMKKIREYEEQLKICRKV